MRRSIEICSAALLLLAARVPAAAQGVDLTVFLGRAFPVYDERLTLRASTPSLPGAEVTVSGNPELRTDGGLVVGGALAVEVGVLGIEGRIDATEIGFDFTGGRYDVRATQPPFAGLAGSVTLGDGRIDADRLSLLSINLRLRTPGPVGLVASGGFSYLPEVSLTGSVPVSIQIAGVQLPGVEPRLRLRVAPGESTSSVGLNGGAGLRAGAGRVAVQGEVRVFYFQDRDLRLDVDGAPVVVDALLDDFNLLRFDPVIVNAQVGLVLKF